MKEKRINLSIYTVMHFIVDLSCIFYLTGMIYVRLPSQQLTVNAAIIYNALAFALPMLLGFFADIIGKNAFVSCFGCLLILINYLMIPDPWVSVVLIGVGNGLFHIGGGRQVLLDSRIGVTDPDTQKRSDRKSRPGLKYAPSGIFIASGALGVFLGRNMAAGYRNIYYVSMWIALAVCVLILAYFGVRQWRYSLRSVPEKQTVGAGMLVMSAMIFFVVIIRSYYGFVARFSWNKGFVIGLIFTLCIVAGKFSGGILSDRLGVKAASIISLGGAGLLALAAEASPVAGCVSILLFNMTMPVTLSLLAEIWYELPGFAFGTLMMALFIGTLLDMMWNISWLSSPSGLLILCLISLALLLGAVIMKEKACDKW